MFKLQLLHDAAQETSARDQQRQLNFAAALDHARQRLEAYCAQPDGEALPALTTAILEVSQMRRYAIEPYLMMSYLFWGHQDYQQAVYFFRIAAKLAPEAEAVKIMQSLLAEGHGEKSAAFPALEVKAGMSAQDRLQQVRLLLDQLPGLLHRLDDCLPVATSAELKRYQDLLDQLETLSQSLDEELEALEQGLDPSACQHALDAFFAQLDGYQERLPDLKSLVGLNTMIETIWTQLEQMDLDAIDPQQWNYLLDACDRIADRLDNLENKAVDVSRVAENYQELIDEIQKIETENF